MRKRTSRRTLGEQQNRAASPRCAGGFPRHGVKRQRWVRCFLPLTLRSLVVILSSCLAAEWQQASAQEAQGGTNMIAEPESAVNSGVAPAPFGDMFGAVAPQDAVGDGFALPADCGMGCAPSWYVLGEALYFVNQGSGPASLSEAFALPEFSYELGMRVTVGRKWDCATGWELSYVGPLKWEVTGEANGLLLDSFFAVPNADVNVSAFDQAEYHRQTYESTLHSAELNKRFYDWDTMSCLFGLRYLEVKEGFSFESQGPLPLAEQGLFTVAARNRLIGPQCGLDIIYPWGASGRFSLIAKTKLGVYANFAEGQMRLVNAGVQEFDNNDDKVAFAFQGELGVLANLQVTRHLSLRCGYELWYLYGLATAAEQTVATLTQATGTDLASDQDTWFNGVTLGGQLTW